jgi:hypothetical protein
MITVSSCNDRGNGTLEYVGARSSRMTLIDALRVVRSER